MDMKTIYFIFATILFLLNAQNKQLPAPAHLSTLNCHPKYPFQSVGDLIITDNNYSSFIIKKKVFKYFIKIFDRIITKNKFLMVIGSTGWCKACCKHEEFFYNLQQRYLLNKDINPFVIFHHKIK